jgi:hypothetical protein
MIHSRYPRKIHRSNACARSALRCGFLLVWALPAACDSSGSLSAEGKLPDASVEDAKVFADVSPMSAGAAQPIDDFGKLGGALSGYAWVAQGTGTTVVTPNPCNDQGCFTNTGGSLCTSGSIAALACTNPGTAQIACDWETNWGTMIGWNVTPVSHQAWGATASSGLAVSYAGGTGEYRLMAHLAGDPDSKVYCIENYVSGQVAKPAAFLSQCWANTGDVLPDFQGVDLFGLQLVSAQTPIDFDYCISAIALY